MTGQAEGLRTEMVLAGGAGALALTGIHQLGQAVLPDAPRMDIVGMRAMAGMRRAAGLPVPDRDRLYWQTLAGDLLSNGVYFSAVAVGDPRDCWRRGAALGVLAGLGALLLPQRMGLGDPPHSQGLRNQVLTVAWYTLGGLAAAAAVDAYERRAPRTPTRR